MHMKRYDGYVTVKFKNVQAFNEEWVRDWLEAQIERCDELEIDDVVIDYEEDVQEKTINENK